MQQAKLTATLEIPENIPIKEADSLVLDHVQRLAAVLGPDSYLNTVLTEAVQYGRSNLQLNLRTGIKAMYEFEIRMLRQENDRLNKDALRLRLSENCQADKARFWKSQIENLAGVREKLEKEAKDLKTQRDNAISMLNTKTCQLDALKREHETLLQNYAGLIATIPDTCVAVLQAENEKLRAENENLQAENLNLQAENEKLRAENEKLRADLEKTCEKYNIRLDKYAELSETLDKIREILNAD